MKISRNWLLEYVDIDCDLKTLCDSLTNAGIEVEAIENINEIPNGIVVGKILERKPHPNADRLSICTVSDGKEELKIVCGASNCDAGNTVPLAKIGTIFKTAEGDFEIKKAKLRGEESFGMLCSAKELGISDDSEGLLELDSSLKAGTPLSEIYPEDFCLELEITSNRPDWLSHWGIARDVACQLDAVAKMETVKLPETKDAAPKNLVTVEDQDLCPRYIGRIIKNVKVGESPDWLKEHLLSIGLRPINNVVDVTNFVLMGLGQPLHAFDLGLLDEERVVIRQAKNGEKITTLDGKDITLKDHHLVIADANKPMALAGVMGGEDSGVTEKTTDILLESAYFYPPNIRSTSRELGISSDSSYRYERGVDYDMVEFASDRATELILELAGGTSTRKIDVNTGAPELKTIKCRFDKVRGLLGFEISNDKMVDIFEKLQLRVSDITEASCLVTVPRFRLDLDREADLIEEVARISGLEAVPVVPVSCKIVNSMRDDSYVGKQEMRDQLINLGLYECMHYSMVSDKVALRDTRFQVEDLVILDNPLSLELAYMRPSLFGVMLDTVERNISRRNMNLRLFELGRVFCANKNLFLEEREECCIILTGLKYPERYSSDLEIEYDFYDLKGIIENWLDIRRISNYSFEATNDKRFMPGMAIQIIINGKSAGVFGKLNNNYTKSWRTPYSVFGAVIDAELLYEVPKRDIEYKAFSQYPSVSRDVAFIAPNSLEHSEVVDFINKSGLEHLISVKVFDLFTDDKLGKDKKSMAYSLTFRHNERTLTDEEINSSFEKLRAKLAKNLGVELR